MTDKQIMPDSIWCDGCGEVKPLLVDQMSGNDTSGKFTNPIDYMCADCRLVITTLWHSSRIERKERSE